VKGTAQTHAFVATKGEIGAAMGAMAIEETISAALVAEEHQILPEKADWLDGPRLYELVDERHRLPIEAHQSAGVGARTRAGHPLVLIGADHALRGLQNCSGHHWIPTVHILALDGNRERQYHARRKKSVAPGGPEL